MYEHAAPQLDKAEAAQDLSGVYAALRELSLDEFVHNTFFPDPSRPDLWMRLPQLPAEQIQRNYVGADGVRLEHMTAAFVRNLESYVDKAFGTRRGDLNILDYGCGWGRILRMMPWFTEPTRLYGVDPVAESLEHCAAGRVPGEFALCDPIPTGVPFEGVTFDVVYAFSVFTHLAERSSRAILQSVRRRISADGVFVITIRPVEFWPLVENVFGAERVREMERLHRSDEYAFLPVDHLHVDGEATFGDASWSFAYMARMAAECGWRVQAGWERSMVDPYQIVVGLRPI
jgi:SAM-dependent methyltransferase